MWEPAQHSLSSAQNLAALRSVAESMAGRVFILDLGGTSIVESSGEVDLLLERDGRYYPIEAKCKTALQKRDARGLRAFRETYPHLRIMAGAIVYAGSECYWVDDYTIAVPWNLRV